MRNSTSTRRVGLAVACGALVMAACGSEDASSSVPPSLSVTPSSTGATVPTTDPPTSDPATTTAPTDFASTTTTTTTTTAVPELAAQPAALTTAGQFGVIVALPEGTGSTVVTEPMAYAMTAQDGRVFMQRSQDAYDPSADTTPFVWSPATAEMTPLDLPLATESSAGSSVKLHDVATVDGTVTVLYETVPPNCANPTDCTGAVMTWEPDSGESTEVTVGNVWEAGFYGLELASNGLIVGTASVSASSGIFLATIGSEAPPTPADLGLQDSYGDCSVCPIAYTIDPTGRFIGWVDSGEGVDEESFDGETFPPNEIAVVDISEAGAFAKQRVVADVSAAYGVLDIADVVLGDEGFVEGRAVFLKGGTAGEGDPFEPVEIDLTTGVIGRIDAVSATLNLLAR